MSTLSRIPTRWLPRLSRPRRRACRLRFDPLEDRTVPSATFHVTSLADSGPGTLRTAISSANATAGADTILFDVAGTINVASQLTLSDTTGGTTIDATSAPGYAGSPVVALRGPSGLHGLDVTTPNNAVKGLQIGGFGIGLYIVGPNGNFGPSGTAANTVVTGDYIGTDGVSAVANSQGVVIDNSLNNRIGTDGDGVNDDAERNLISGNTAGGIKLLQTSTGNVIAGNYVGTNASGNGPVPNGGQAGILLLSGANNNRIGTSGHEVNTAAERNVISGNSGAGIYVGSNTNVIAGNYVGVGSNGTTAVGNGVQNGTFNSGIYLDGSGNRVGTDGDGAGDAAERNVISANTNNGIFINGGRNNNVIAGNYIGTDATGSFGVGNTFVGVAVTGGSNNRVGTDGDGTGDAAEGNVVSGNGSEGVLVQNSSTTGTVIAGNFIGTDAAGAVALPNRQIGVHVTANAANTRIGTNGDGVSDPLERNVISGNLGSGIDATSGTGTVIAGNYIGTDATGALDRGNTGSGVSVSATGARVGSNLDGVNDAAEGNLISGNDGDGVTAFGSGALVAGNRIGTTATGTGGVANSLAGISFQFGAANNTASGNTVAFNTKDGVQVIGTSSVNDRITKNAIFSNGGLGINLSNSSPVDGRTPNDTGDADTGANNLQNFPVISSAAAAGGTTTVVGSLNSTANTTFTLEFFASTAADPSGFGEGERFLGSTTVTTDASGNASFTATLPTAANSNDFITATATDPNGNTSEFSGNSTRVPPPNHPPVAANDAYTGNEDNALTVPAPGVLANDSDADGNTITAVLVSGPTNGSLTLNPNGSFTYTPNANFNGTDSFTYKANDGQADSNVATVTITINPVNDAPSFTKGANQTVVEDAGPQTVAGWATNISAGPADEAGQQLQFQVTTTNPGLFAAAPAISASGTLTFTPAADANGSATVTVTLKDNGGTANGEQDTSGAQTFTIAVTAVNDPPIARDDTATTNEDAGVTVNVLANDSPGPATATDEASQTLTVVSVTQPAHGTVTINPDNTITYAPAANYNGPDSFTYTIQDSGAPPLQATASGTITINPVNDRPTAAGTTVTMAEDGGPVAIDLRPLVGDVETATADLTFAVTTGPSSGSLTATATAGVYTYTPAPNFNGTDTFTYTVTDTGDPAGSGVGVLTSPAATVSIVVTPVNDPPVAADDAYATDEDATLTLPAPGVLANDSDVDGDLFQAVLVAGPTHGSLSLRPDGSFTYTPAANFHGTDTFTYNPNDGQADGNVATVTITVNSVNDPPVAADDSATTTQGVAVVIPVLANDTDVDGDSLTMSAVTQPGHGAVTVNGNGTVSYAPAAGFYGFDSFAYTASDGNGGTSTATVHVSVAATGNVAVAIDPAGYDGTFVVDNSDRMTGANTVHVTPGTHILNFGNAAFSFVVDAFGTVTSNNPSAATGSAGGLRFHAAPVTIDTGAYADFYQLNNEPDRTRGNHTYTLVAGLMNWTLKFSNDGNFLRFDTDASGNVTSQNAAAAVGVGSTLRLNTTTVTVDPGAYDGYYMLLNRDDVSSGRTDFVVVRGVPDWEMIFANFESRLGFDVNADGTVTSRNTAAAAASGSVLQFQTATATIDPGAYSGYYTLRNNRIASTGVASFVFVRNISNWQAIFTHEGNLANAIRFDTDAAGNVTSRNPAAATGAGSTLHFNTVGIRIDPQTYTGNYEVESNRLGATGVVEVSLVTGVPQWELGLPDVNGNRFRFDLDAAGDPTPTQLPVTVGGQGYTFLLSHVDRAPVADDDAATTNQGAAVVIPVLANDTDTDGDPLTVAAVTQPAHGSAAVNGDGTVTYAPAAGFYGHDAFTYTASDGKGGTATGTVHVSVAATGNVKVAIDPGAYTGIYTQHGSGPSTGPQTLSVAPGHYQIDIDYGNFGFDVDAFGDVTSGDPLAADGSAGALRFRTTAVTIDPAAYTGVYNMHDVSHFLNVGPGPQTFVVVAHFNNYIVDIDYGYVGFDVDANGNVTSHDPLAAEGTGNTLRFHTTTIQIDPAAYTGLYNMTDVTREQNAGPGPQSFTVVAHFNNYTVYIDYGYVGFDVDEHGNVTSHDPLAATATGNTLRFNTTTIHIDPAGYDGVYNMHDVSRNLNVGPGPQTFTVVRHFTNYIVDIDYGYTGFDVDENGKVTSHDPVTTEGDGNTLRFHTTNVTVHPVSYAGVYSLNDVSQNQNVGPGPVCVAVLPGFNNYTLSAGNSTGVFSVDAAGVPAPSQLVLDVNGQPVTFELAVCVPPTVAISGSSAAIAAHPSPLTLSATGGDPIEDWTITWGDGTVQVVARSPSTVPHTYGAAGTYSISATATNDDGTFAAAGTVTVSVAPNQAPVAADDAATTNQGAAIVIPVLANDTDADGDPLTVAAVAQPADGTATVNADGTITYAPAAGFYGFDSFTYTAADGHGGTATATVHLSVAATGALTVTFDPGAYTGTYRPAGHSPEAGIQTLDLLPGSYLIGFEDENRWGFTVDPYGTVTSQNPVAAEGGAGVLRFHTTTIHIDPANYTGFYRGAGVTGGASVFGPQDFVVVPGVDNYRISFEDENFWFYDVDPAGNVTSQNAAAADGVGNTLRFHTTTIHIDPMLYTGNYTGAAVTRGAQVSGPQDFVLVPGINNYRINFEHENRWFYNVDAAGNVTSQNTVAAEGVGNTLRFHTTTIHVDPGSYTGPYTLASVSHNQTVFGPACFRIVPNIDNYRVTVGGAFHFFNVGPGGTPDPAAVTVTANGVPYTFTLAADACPPTAVADSAITAEDTAVSINVLANDSDFDGDPLAVTAVTQGAHGSVAITAAGTVAYTPAANFNGTDSFTYTVLDNTGRTGTATVSVTVAPVNDPPVAVADRYVTDENSALAVTAPGVLANDSDVDGDPVHAVLVAGPAHGAVDLHPDGSFSYTPAVNFSGTDSFTYKANDGQADSNVATVTITVNPVNALIADAGYILNGSGTAVTAAGSATINLPGGLFVDSTAAAAVAASGSAQVEVGGNLQVAGGVSVGGSARTGTVLHHPPAGDPLAGLPTPAVGGLTGYGAVTVSGNTTRTLQPGTYTSITISGNAKVTLASGAYVILGGGLTVSGNGSLTADANGVFIFNAGSAYNGSADGGTFGAITLGGNGAVSLKPLATGPYAGVLIFQSRSNAKVLNIGGAATLSTTGTIYAPAAQLAVSGNGTLHDTLVVNTLYVSGSAGAFQLTDGTTTGYQSSTINMLTNPIVTVAVQDDVGAGLDPVQVDELTAAMDYLNSALSQFGVSMTWAEGGAAADMHVHFAAATPEGGFSDGVLGFTTAGNDVYFAAGWNLYTGSDPAGIQGNQFDFQTLATHELAHTLGLGESADPQSVMYEYLAPGTVRRTLTDSNLELINTDADRYMKAAVLAAPGVGGAVAAVVGSAAASPAPTRITTRTMAATALAASIPPAIAPPPDLTVGASVPTRAGSASGVLMGGAGDDLHVGAAGRDLLVGGFGTEHLSTSDPSAGHLDGSHGNATPDQLTLDS